MTESLCTVNLPTGIVLAKCGIASRIDAHAALYSTKDSPQRYCIIANHIVSAGVALRVALGDKPPTHSHEPIVPMSLYTALTSLRLWKRSILAHFVMQSSKVVSMEADSVVRPVPAML
jgi:hypothetical protein